MLHLISIQQLMSYHFYNYLLKIGIRIVAQNLGVSIVLCHVASIHFTFSRRKRVYTCTERCIRFFTYFKFVKNIPASQAFCIIFISNFIGVALVGSEIQL